jgi:hypothetical protein
VVFVVLTEPLCLKSDPQMRSHQRNFVGDIAFSRRKFPKAYAKAGFKEWPLDALRHSFGTYRQPILNSTESLALEMGNSPDVIFRHYRRARKAKFYKAIADSKFFPRALSPERNRLTLPAIIRMPWGARLSAALLTVIVEAIPVICLCQFRLGSR